MKICYINPTYLIRRPLAELVDQMSKEHEVAVFRPIKPFSSKKDQWHADDHLKKAKVYSYWAINPPTGNFEWPVPISPMFFIRMFQIYSKYDVLHMWTYFYVPTILVELTKKMFKKTKLILSCDTIPGYSFSVGKKLDKKFKWYTEKFKKLLFGSPDIVHLYGESLRKYVKNFKIEESKIKILPTGINIENITSAEKVQRDEFELKDEDFVLIYAGLLVPRKGIDSMIKIMKKLKTNKSIKLLLVGKGPMEEEYKKIAEKEKLTQQIKFAGWRKDIPGIMKMSDALLLPSRGEGLPGIVMEAMAAGLPIIASDIPCIPDLVKQEENGYLCKSEDIDSFVKNIKKIAKDEKLKEQMGEKSKKMIENFSWKKLKKEYEEIYKKN